MKGEMKIYRDRAELAGEEAKKTFELAESPYTAFCESWQEDRRREDRRKEDRRSK